MSRNANITKEVSQRVSKVNCLTDYYSKHYDAVDKLYKRIRKLLREYENLSGKLLKIITQSCFEGRFEDSYSIYSPPTYAEEYCLYDIFLEEVVSLKIQSIDEANKAYDILKYYTEFWEHTLAEVKGMLEDLETRIEQLEVFREELWKLRDDCNIGSAPTEEEIKEILLKDIEGNIPPIKLVSSNQVYDRKYFDMVLEFYHPQKVSYDKAIEKTLEIVFKGEYVRNNPKLYGNFRQAFFEWKRNKES